MARWNGRLEFAVIGLGRFGSSLALTLMNRGYSVLGIDRNPDVVQHLADQLTRTISLDTTSEEALQAIDITSFDTVVVAIGQSFEANLMTTVALKSLGVRHVICKALSDKHKHILLRVGADKVVLPEHEAGQRLAYTLAEPNVLDHLELGSGFSVAEVRVPPRLVGVSLAQSSLRNRYGINVLAIRHAGTLIVSPSPDYVFADQDVMLAIGSDHKISEFCSLS